MHSSGEYSLKHLTGKLLNAFCFSFWCALLVSFWKTSVNLIRAVLVDVLALFIFPIRSRPWKFLFLWATVCNLDRIPIQLTVEFNLDLKYLPGMIDFLHDLYLVFAPINLTLWRPNTHFPLYPSEALSLILEQANFNTDIQGYMLFHCPTVVYLSTISGLQVELIHL